MRLLKNEAIAPDGLKAGVAVIMKGRLRVNPAKDEYFQVPHGSSLPGTVVAREHDDLGHVRVKIDTNTRPNHVYFWIFNGKLFNRDPFAKILHGSVTKRSVLEHYRSVWHVLRKEIIGHRLTVVFGFGGQLKVSRLYPFQGNRTIEIANWHDLDELVYLHGIEIVPDLELKEEPGMLRRAVIDVDSKASLEDTKHVVILLYKRLLELGQRPYIISTASKAGFHVRFDNDKPIPAMELKAKVEKEVLFHLWATSDVIRRHCLDPHRRMYPKDPAIRGGKVFLDLSPMKSRGGIKAIGSINAKTFGIVQRVPLNKLADFLPRSNAVT